jgi:hypothetical protein
MTQQNRLPVLTRNAQLPVVKTIWNFNASLGYPKPMWMIVVPIIVILWVLTMAALARHRWRRRP